MARLEAAVSVVCLLRFGSDDLRLRREGREGEAGARYHATTTDWRHHSIKAIRLLNEFFRTCALSGDHSGIVVGVYEIAPCRSLHLGKGRLTGTGRRLAFGNDTAKTAHRILLCLRGCAGHHHVAWNAALHSGIRQAGCMIARGMCCDAFGRLLLAKPEHRVRGAPHLKGTRLLKVLAFEEQLATGKFVEVVRGADRRAANIGADPRVGVQHVLVRRDVHLVILHHAASFCAAAVWPR